MLTKRIIACLDVADGQVVKGVQFDHHKVVGSIVDLANQYSNDGIDEIVLYDIKASVTNTTVDFNWVEKVAQKINIPFCVAGKIDDLYKVEKILNSGADKVSINSPALKDPNIIDSIAKKFGSSTLVVGIDTKNNEIFKNTGDPLATQKVDISLMNWVKEVTDRGAGEIVINSMQLDGLKAGFDIPLLNKLSQLVNIPIIASGGAGKKEHFKDVFKQTNVSGALAATIFHKNIIGVPELKNYLMKENICVRI